MSMHEPDMGSGNDAPQYVTATSMKHDPSITKARIVAWLKTHDEHYEPANGSIVITLHSCLGNDPSDSLSSWNYYPYVPKEEGGTGVNLDEQSAQSIANEVYECASEDASEKAQVLRYQVANAYNEKDKILFSVAPESAHRLENETFSEEASNRGLIFQQMRHNEQIMRLALGTMEVQLEQANRTINSMREEMRQLYEDRRQNVQVYEELLSQKHIRDMEIRQIVSDEKRQERAGDMIAPLVPLLMNKVLGQKILKEKTSAPLEMLKAVFSGITEEQLNVMLSACDPSQRAALTELLKMLYDAHEKGGGEIASEDEGEVQAQATGTDDASPSTKSSQEKPAPAPAPGIVQSFFDPKRKM